MIATTWFVFFNHPRDLPKNFDCGLGRKGNLQGICWTRRRWLPLPGTGGHDYHWLSVSTTCVTLWLRSSSVELWDKIYCVPCLYFSLKQGDHCWTFLCDVVAPVECRNGSNSDPDSGAPQGSVAAAAAGGAIQFVLLVVALAYLAYLAYVHFQVRQKSSLRTLRQRICSGALAVRCR